MTSIVSGNGLGLYDTSGNRLDGFASSGDGATGRLGQSDNVTVNSTTGNLIIQRLDDFIVAQGPDLSLVRTYNSLGKADGDNNDGWRMSGYQSIIGAGGAATVTKVFGDGAQVVFTLGTTVGSVSTYTSSAGNGASDTLKWDTTTSTWTYSDGNSLSTETYNAAGQITQIVDTDNNKITYNYTGTLITSIIDASGQTTYLDYTGNNLTKIRTVSASGNETQVYYKYDTSNRLTQVIVDLSPADNTEPTTTDLNNDGLREGVNGQSYVTTYTYDSVSGYVNSITNGDGTKVSFTYAWINGQYRVKTMTDGMGAVTTYDYQFPDGTTKVWGAVTEWSAGGETISDPQIGFDGYGYGAATYVQGGNLYARTYDPNTEVWSGAVLLESNAAPIVGAPMLVISKPSRNAPLVAWVQSDGTSEQVYYRYLSYGVWSATSKVSNSTTAIKNVTLCNSAGNGSSGMAVGWLQRNGANNWDLYVWSVGSAGYAAELVDTLPGDVSMPAISYSYDRSPNIIATWSQSDGTNQNLYYATKQLYKTGWSTPVVVETLDAPLTDVQLINGKASTALVYVKGGKLYVRSFDAVTTKTWSAPVLLGSSTQPVVGRPSIATTGYFFTIGWAQSDGTATSAYVARGYMLGDRINWASQGEQVDQTTEEVSEVTTLTDQRYGDTVVVWTQNNGQRKTVNTRQYLEFGGKWQSIVQLGTVGASTQIQPKLDFLSDDVGYPTSGFKSINVIWKTDTGLATVNFAPLKTARTTVTDALINQTVYESDTSGRLAAVTDARGNRTTYGYDTNGNLTTITDALNRTTTRIYDASNNVKLVRDAAGNTVSYTYDAGNRKVTETVYVTPDPDGTGALQPSQPLTTRYAYDALGHLRFTVSPEGRVTEYRYNPKGQRTDKIVYTADLFNLSGKLPTDTVLLDEIKNWPTNKTQLEHTVYTYDPLLGQLDTATTYAQNNADGTPNTSAASIAITKYVYDMHGRLTQTIDARGMATADPNDYVTTYNYDGMGRLLSTSQWVSATEPARSTTYFYDDVGNQYKITSANGLVTTFVYNRNGELITKSEGPGDLGTTTYAYDAAQRLRVTTDPNGNSSYRIYNAKGLLSATVDALGALTEYVYDNLDNLAQRIRYITAVSVANLNMRDASGTVINTTVESLRPTTLDPLQDRRTYYVYDSDSRLIYTLTPTDSDPTTTSIPVYVEQNFYDGLNRKTDTVAYATAINIANLTAVLTLDNVRTRILTNADDRQTRYFYDNDSLLRATLDGEGYLTEYQYNAAGEQKHSVRNAKAVNVIVNGVIDVNATKNMRATGDLTQLLANLSAQGASADDQHNYNFYNARGQLIAQLDAENFLAEYAYDSAGNRTSETRYYHHANAYTGTPVLANLRPTNLNARVTVTAYDGANQVISVTRQPENLVTSYSYDNVGNLLSTTTAQGTGEARTQHARYDKQGRVKQELSAEGDAALTAALATLLAQNPSATQADKDEVENDIWNRYGSKYDYDLGGRRTSATDANQNRTLYFYDADNRLRYTVNALGEVNETVYNVLGAATDTRTFSKRLTASQLSSIGLGGAANDIVVELLEVALGNTVGTANFLDLSRIATDSAGNIYVVDSGNNTIRKITSTGVVTTFAGTAGVLGSADGTGAAASFSKPSGIATDSAGNVYVADSGNNTIRKITSSGVVTTLAGHADIVGSSDGLGAGASFANPTDISIDSAGNIYVVDSGNNTIRKITSTGVVTTFAGTAGVLGSADGTGAAASFSKPSGIATDSAGNVYVADSGNNTIRKITSSGVVTTLAGHAGIVGSADGLGAGASFANPTDIAIDSAGNIYVVDSGNNTIRKMTSTGVVTTLAGTAKIPGSADGAGADAMFFSPLGIATDSSDNIFISDRGNISIRKMTSAGEVTTLVRGIDADPDGHQSFNYTLRGAVRQAIDGLGNASTYTYNAFGELANQDVVKNDIAHVLSTFQYDRRGLRTDSYEDTATGGFNRHLQTAYDAFGRITRTVDGNGNVTQSTYRIGQAEDDRVGRVITTTQAFGNAVAASSTRTYDAFGRVLTFTDALNHTTTYTYDDAVGAAEGHHTLTIQTPEGISTITETNAHGETVSVTDGNGNVTHYAYDNNGNLLSTTDALNQTQTSTYDHANRRITTTDIYGTVTYFEYDAANRVLYKTVDPQSYVDKDGVTQTKANGLNLKTAYAYDGQGRTLTVIDANGIATKTDYDAEGHVKQVTVDPTSYTDKDGVTVTNANGLNLITAYTYDAQGRMTTKTEGSGTADARTTQYVYDKLGRRTQEIRDPGGLNLTTRYVYDLNNNVTAKIEGSGTTDARTTRYVYDVLNRMTDTIDGKGGVVHTDYDRMGHVIKTTAYAGAIDLTNANETITAAQLVTLMTSRTDPKTVEDRITQYAYDMEYRLVYQVDGMNALTAYTYDNNGNVIQTTRYATVVPAGTANTKNAYDALVNTATTGNIVNADKDQISRTVYDVANRVRFTIDAMGYIVETQYDNNLHTKTMREYAQKPATAPTVYSEANVKSAVATSAEDHVTKTQYDNAGRTSSITYAMGTKDQYSDSFGYDNVGNRIRHTNGRNYNEYTKYDAANRVKRHIDFGGYVIDYGYGAVGNQTSKTVYMNAVTQTPTGDRWAYDAPNPTPNADPVSGDRVYSTVYDQFNHVYEELDPNNVATRYFYNAFGQVVLKIEAFATPYERMTYTVYDKVGNLIEQTSAYNSSDAAISRFGYDAFGNQTSYIDPRGVELAEQDTEWAIGERARLGYIATSLTADTGELQSELTSTEKQALRDLYTTYQFYDLKNYKNRVVDALKNETKTQYDAFGNIVKTTDPRKNSAYFYYDALNRITFQVNPELYAEETTYNAFGKAENTFKYANRVQIPAGSVLDENHKPLALATAPSSAVPYLILDVVNDQHTQTLYDVTGNVSTVIEAVGAQRITNYDHAGNVTQKVDANGNATSFTYDANNHLYSETLPITSTDSTNAQVSVINRYEYDAVGNRTKESKAYGLPEQRVTEYAYDKTNRLVSVLAPQTLAPINTAASTDATVQANAGGRVTAQVEGYYPYSTNNKLFRIRGSLTVGISQRLANMHADGYIGKWVAYINGSTTPTVVWTNKIPLSISNKVDFSDIPFLDGTVSNTVISTFDIYATFPAEADGQVYGQSIAHFTQTATFPAGTSNTIASNFDYGDVWKIVGQPSSVASMTYSYWVEGSAATTTGTIATRDENGSFVVSVPSGLTGQYRYQLDGYAADGTKISSGEGSFSLQNGLPSSSSGTMRCEGVLNKWVIQPSADPAAMLVTVAATNYYDLRGNLIKAVDANGNITTYTYDRNNNRLSMIDAEGYLHEYKYNRVGNITLDRTYQKKIARSHAPAILMETLSAPLPKDKVESRQTSFFYDANNHLVATKTGEVLLTQTSLDASVAAVWTHKDVSTNANTTKLSHYRGIVQWQEDTPLPGDVVPVGDISYSYDAKGDGYATWAQDDRVTVSGVSTIQHNLYAARYKTDAGWQPALKIATSDTNIFEAPQVVADAAGNALVVAKFTQNSIGRLVWCYYNLNSTRPTWSTSQFVTATTAAQSSPVSGVDGAGNVVMVWTQENSTLNATEVYASRFVPATGWQSATLLGSTAKFTGLTAIVQPKVVVDALGNATVVWTDYIKDNATGVISSVLKSRRYSVATDWANAWDAVTVMATKSNSQQEIQSALTTDTLGNATLFWSLNGLYACRYLVGQGWESAPQVLDSLATGPLDAVTDSIGNILVVFREQSANSTTADPRFDVLSKLYLNGIGWQANDTVKYSASPGDLLKVAFNGRHEAVAVWTEVPDAAIENRVYSNWYRNGAWQELPLIIGKNAQKLQLILDHSLTVELKNQAIVHAKLYNENGQDTVLIDPNGNLTYKFYDKVGRQIAQVDALGYMTFWVYDAFGNVTRETRFAKSLGEVAPVEFKGISPNTDIVALKDKLVQAASPDDRVTVYTYDRLNRKKTQEVWLSEYGTANINRYGGSYLYPTYSSWAITRYVYDAVGNLVQQTNAENGVTNYVYDGVNRKTYQIDPQMSSAAAGYARKVTAYRYDGVNNLLSTTESEKVVPATSALPPNAGVVNNGINNLSVAEYHQSFSDFGNGVAIWKKQISDGSYDIYSSSYYLASGWSNGTVIANGVDVSEMQVAMDPNGEFSVVVFSVAGSVPGEVISKAIGVGAPGPIAIDRSVSLVHRAPTIHIGTSGVIDILWARNNGSSYTLRSARAWSRNSTTWDSSYSIPGLSFPTSDPPRIEFDTSSQTGVVLSNSNGTYLLQEVVDKGQYQATSISTALGLTTNALQVKIDELGNYQSLYASANGVVAEFKQTYYSGKLTSYPSYYAPDATSKPMMSFVNQTATMVWTQKIGGVNKLLYSIGKKGDFPLNVYQTVDIGGRDILQPQLVTGTAGNSLLVWWQANAAGGSDLYYAWSQENFVPHLLRTTTIAPQNVRMPYVNVGAHATQILWEEPDSANNWHAYLAVNYGNEWWLNPNTDSTAIAKWTNILANINTAWYSVPSADAHIAKYEYDAAGHVVKQTDAAGTVQKNYYDKNGNLTRSIELQTIVGEYSWYDPTLSKYTDYSYDKLNRQTIRVISNPIAATAQLSNDHTKYNAYGQIVAQGRGGYQDGKDAVVYFYDAAGRLVKTNKGDGVYRGYVYDAAGNETLAIQSAGRVQLPGNDSIGTIEVDIREMPIEKNEIARLDPTTVKMTQSVYDARNQLIQTYQAPMDFIDQKVLGATKDWLNISGELVGGTIIPDMSNQIQIQLIGDDQAYQKYVKVASGVAAALAAAGPFGWVAAYAAYQYVYTEVKTTNADKIGFKVTLPKNFASVYGDGMVTLEWTNPDTGIVRTYSIPGNNSSLQGNSGYTIDTANAWASNLPLEEILLLSPGFHYVDPINAQKPQTWTFSDADYWAQELGAHYQIKVYKQWNSSKILLAETAGTYQWHNVPDSATGQKLNTGLQGLVSSDISLSTKNILHFKSQDAKANSLQLWLWKKGTDKSTATPYWADRMTWGQGVQTDAEIAKNIGNSNYLPVEGWFAFDFGSHGFALDDYNYEFKTYTETAGAGILISHIKGEVDMAQPGKLLVTKFIETAVPVLSKGTSYTNVIVRSQRYNAFGEVRQEVDGRGFVTDFVYDTRGLLLSKLDPLTDYTDEKGFIHIHEVRPETRYLYDMNGRVVGVIDANGNFSTQMYDAVGNIVLEGHLDGNVYYAYDAYGNLRYNVNEVGEKTRYKYDKKGRVTRVNRQLWYGYNSSARYDTYTYDEQNHRISHTNGLGKTETTAYDLLGRVTRQVGFDGIKSVGYDYFDALDGSTTTTTNYFLSVDSSGAATAGIEGTTNPAGDNGRSLDTKDYFGRLLTHTDRGGRKFTYTYNRAGWLVEQKGDPYALIKNDQDIQYEYYHNGYLKQVQDLVTGNITSYAYDRNGNRTYETMTEKRVTKDSLGNITVNFIDRQKTHAEYDELNRLKYVDDFQYAMSIEYDKNGNRKHIFAYYHDGSNKELSTQDLWYTYDFRNRFSTTMGALVKIDANGNIVNDATGKPIPVATKMVDTKEIGRRPKIMDVAHEAGTVVLADGRGYRIDYNGRSQRIGATYIRNGQTMKEVYSYTVGDLLIVAYMYNIAANGAYTLTGEAIRKYDAIGDLVQYQELDGNSNVLKDTRTSYYANGLTKQEISDRYTVSGGTRSLSGTTTSNYTYFANRELKYLASTDVSGNNTVKRNSTYAYEYWDSAKTSNITTTTNDPKNPGLPPAISSFIYDVNGHLIRMEDKDARSLKYILDADGRVFYREEVANTSAANGSRFQNYYYLNGVMIGDSGTFASTNTDYAEGIGKTAYYNYWESQRAQIDPDDNSDSQKDLRDRVNGHSNSENLLRYAPVRSANFDQNYRAINDRYPYSAPGQYTLQNADIVGTSSATDLTATAKNVATKIWGDQSLWFYIVDANGWNLSNTTILVANQSVIIPNVVANMHNNASTIRVYAPGELIGDTTPTIPTPAAKKENVIAEIIVVVVAVVVFALVAAYLGPAAAKFFEFLLGEGLLATMATGAVTYGAAAAASDLAAQATANGLGIGDGKIHWDKVARAGVIGGVAGGLTSGIQYLIQTTEFLSFLDGVKWWQSGLRGMINAAVDLGVSYAYDSALGHKTNEFDYASLAAATVAGAVTAGMDPSSVTTQATHGLVSGGVKASTRQGRRVLERKQDHIEWVNVAGEALKQAAQSALSGAIRNDILRSRASAGAHELINNINKARSNNELPEINDEFLDRYNDADREGIKFAMSSKMAVNRMQAEERQSSPARVVSTGSVAFAPNSDGAQGRSNYDRLMNPSLEDMEKSGFRTGVGPQSTPVPNSNEALALSSGLGNSKLTSEDITNIRNMLNKTPEVIGSAKSAYLSGFGEIPASSGELPSPFPVYRKMPRDGEVGYLEIPSAQDVRDVVSAAAAYHKLPPELTAAILGNENKAGASEYMKFGQFLERVLQSDVAAAEIPFGEGAFRKPGNGSSGIANLQPQTLRSAVQYVEGTLGYSAVPADVMVDTPYKQVPGLDWKMDLYYQAAHVRQIVDRVAGTLDYTGPISAEMVREVGRNYNGGLGYAFNPPKAISAASRYGNDLYIRLYNAAQGIQPLYFYGGRK